jgi:hypothetical protein
MARHANGWWNEERDNILIMEYRRFAANDLAKRLGCTNVAVRTRAFKLGLTSKFGEGGDCETTKTIGNTTVHRSL